MCHISMNSMKSESENQRYIRKRSKKGEKRRINNKYVQEENVVGKWKHYLKQTNKKQKKKKNKKVKSKSLISVYVCVYMDVYMCINVVACSWVSSKW